MKPSELRREKIGRAMVVVGAVFYALGAIPLFLGAPAAVWAAPFSLSATMWLWQWFVRP